MTAILPGAKGWPAILLGRAGAKDPTNLPDAIKAGAFDGLTRAIRQLGPAGTIAAVEESGLRGRGGAGRPTGTKWLAAASTPGKARHVVANGYGADPASSTDRTLLETDPFAVIEGAAIAAFAIGAEDAWIAVRAGDAAALRTLEAALAAALDAGFVGEDALASGRRIEVHVSPVQGAYMLGEDTVLLKALEGKRGQPEQQPPGPETHGLFGQPTLVHNVQTLAAVPWILHHGAAAFRAIGTPEAPGTILVELRTPDRSGVAEVPLGTTLREVVALAGGGTARKVKAVVVGGPAGGILPPEQLGTPYSFEGLRTAGAHVGSGSVIVADERACVVDLARVLTRFCADEACGKTIPCRIGLRRLAEIAEHLAAGTSRRGDFALAGDLAADIVGSALCDHERQATLPLLSGLRYFRAELDAHLERGACPAGVCRPIPLAAASSSAPTRATA